PPGGVRIAEADQLFKIFCERPLSSFSSKSLDSCRILVDSLHQEGVCQRVAGKYTLRNPSARNSTRLWPTAKRAPAKSIGHACYCSLRKGKATAKSLGS